MRGASNSGLVLDLNKCIKRGVYFEILGKRKV